VKRKALVLFLPTFVFGSPCACSLLVDTSGLSGGDGGGAYDLFVAAKPQP
jgi:hypothetical protein